MKTIFTKHLRELGRMIGLGRFGVNALLILGLLVTFAATAPRAGAQCNMVVVTGTVTDPNGIPWSNALLNVNLIPAGGGTCVTTGANFQSHFAIQLSSTGFFQITIPTNASISPGSSQWQFQFSSNGIQPPLGTGPQSFTYTGTIAGAGDISSTLSALAPSQLFISGDAVAAADATAQAANITTTTLYTPAAAGKYRVSCYVIVTQAATTSSTMPSCTIGWTDKDNSTAQSSNITATQAGNTLTTFADAVHMIDAKAATNITYATASYASSGATPMQYAIHLKLEYLGP